MRRRTCFGIPDESLSGVSVPLSLSCAGFQHTLSYDFAVLSMNTWSRVRRFGDGPFGLRILTLGVGAPSRRVAIE